MDEMMTNVADYDDEISQKADTKLVYAILEPGDFIVRFDKIFNKPELEVYNTFRIGTKRSFKNEIERVLNTYYQILFDENEQLTETGQYFMLNLLDIKNTLMTKKALSIDELFQYTDKLINADNKAIVTVIKKFVDDHYEEMDENDLAKYKKNKDLVQLVISNDQAKAICAVSYIHRLMIPVVSEYLALNKVALDADEDDSEDLCAEDICCKIFEHLLCMVTTEPKRTKNKLYKLVESRVAMFIYSAQSFWELASGYAENPSTFTDYIYKKILTSALHKMDMLEDDFHVVSYLQSIINNQISFRLAMTWNDTLSYYNPAVGTQLTKKSEDKDMTLDRVESQLARSDEGMLLIEEENKDIVDKLPELLDVSAEDNEVQECLSYIKINQIQEQLVSLITNKYFKSSTTIRTCSAREYAKVLLCCSKYLAKNNFVILSKVIISNCLVYVDKLTITGVKIKAAIEATKNYQSLIKHKYANYRNEVEKPLQALISTIRSSTFVDANNDNIFNDGITIDEIANEVVELMWLI